jgi:hypothetical protein
VNLLDARIVLRPRQLGEILDLAFLYAHASRRQTRRLSLSTLLPAFLACLGLRYLAHLSWLWVWIIAYGLASVCLAPFTLLASRLLFAERTSTRRVWKDFARGLLSLSLARLAALFMQAAGAALILLFLPLAMAHTLFLDEAILLERMPLSRAFSRASAVVRRQLAPAQFFGLAALLLRFLAVVFVDFVGRLFLEYVLQWDLGSSGLWSEGGSALALLGLFGVVPYLAYAKFLLYIDLRTRKEGWDLQLQLMSFAQSEGDAP